MGDELKYVRAKSLECPMCMDIFKEPKILFCSHTYCKGCLECLLECHEDNTSIRCPACRVVNQLPSRDVSQLQTNLALQSLLEDATEDDQSCTDCKAKGKSEQAKVHCQNCWKYFCLDCLKIHDISGFSYHEVMPVHEVATGKTPSRQRRRCRIHQEEEEDQCFCCNCQKYVCMKCGVTEHVFKGHQIIDASAVYEQSQKKADEELKSVADLKQESLKKYINIIDQQKEETSKVCEQCIADINQAYDESVQQLGERKEILIQEVTKRMKKLETELQSLKENAQQQSSQVTTMTNLLVNKTQVLLNTETLAAYLTLREDLQNVLTKQNLDYDYPVNLGRNWKQIAFHKNGKTKHIDLGSIYEKNAEPALANSMNAMTATPSGMMAVGCCNGGIKIFSADGMLHKTVLIDLKVHGLDFLSDGRCVVGSTRDFLSLYSPEYEKLDVQFESVDDGVNELGFGGLAVTADDRICVGNMENKVIEIFLPVGGKAVRKIPYGYGPYQMISYDNDLLITNMGVVRVVDTDDGSVKQQKDLTDPEWGVFAAVTQSKTVLIAWVNHDQGLVTVEEYAENFELIHDLVYEYEFEKSERYWYSLGEFTSGVIAFCTPERLYIFTRGVTCSFL